MIKHVLLIIIGLLIITIHSNAQPSQALEDLVARIVQPYLEEDNTHQLQVGIIERGYTYHYSFIGNKQPNIDKVDSTALFGIGSVTKIFTTSLLAAMIAQNIIKLNHSITDYLPDSVVTANKRLQKITIEQLATHTSGFPKMPRNLPMKMKNKDNPYAYYRLQDAYEYLMSYKPSMNKKRIKALKKGKKIFTYSHFGMGLLGHLLENAADKNYNELLNQYIFQPLDVKDTGFLEEIASKKNILKGYDFSGNPKPQQHYASLGGSEALYASLRDLVRFTEANMKPTSEYSFLANCFNIKNKTDDKKVYAGLGWFIIERGKHKKFPLIYTHSGKTGGFSSYVAFIEATQTAVIVLSNSTNKVDEYGISILELINR
ncbi:MAG: serine hydrolase domain-containing protein [Chitinophagales bacterium]